MNNSLLTSILMLAATAASAAPPPQNFAGKWVFDPAQSKNIGMMAQASITTVIVQTKTQVIVDDTSMFKGQPDTQRTLYDLTGAPITNTSMMTGPATTRSHWEGTHLVTEWVSPGAIAGTGDKRDKAAATTQTALWISPAIRVRVACAPPDSPVSPKCSQRNPRLKVSFDVIAQSSWRYIPK